MCNIESLGKMNDFKALELIDLSNNFFGQKFEVNAKLIQGLKEKVKNFKITE